MIPMTQENSITRRAFLGTVAGAAVVAVVLAQRVNEKDIICRIPNK
jgi:hypothetical protein